VTVTAIPATEPVTNPRTEPAEPAAAEPAVTSPAVASPAVASSAGRRRLGLRRRWAVVRARNEAGMSTAEYAVGTIAACAFAAVLYRVVTGGSVVTALGHLVQRALDTLS